MSEYAFRNLLAWQKAQSLAVEVLFMVRDLPNDRATTIVASQLLRSATSVAANIAEGHGRFSRGAYRNHLSIARGSANETLSWLDLLRRTSLIGEEQEKGLAQTYDEVLRLISARMIEFDRQRQSSRLEDERERYAAE